MNGLHLGGLDARSVMVGAGLVLAGMVAAKAGGLVPLFVIGGVIWFVGTKKGWWGEKRRDARRGPLATPPAVFEDWHRQMHTSGQPHGHGHGNGHGSGYVPAPQPSAAPTWQAAAPAAPAAPANPEPQDAEIRIPVRQAADAAPTAPGHPQPPVSPYAADYQRTVGENYGA